MFLLFLSWFLTCNGTKWPKLCLCAVKKLLTHSLHIAAENVSICSLHFCGTVIWNLWTYLLTYLLTCIFTVTVTWQPLPYPFNRICLDLLRPLLSEDSLWNWNWWWCNADAEADVDVLCVGSTCTTLVLEFSLVRLTLAHDWTEISSLTSSTLSKHTSVSCQLLIWYYMILTTGKVKVKVWHRTASLIYHTNQKQKNEVKNWKQTDISK